MLKKRPTSLVWLNRILLATVVMACVTAAILTYLLAGVLHQPLHPIAAAADEPSLMDPSEAMLRVTPRATATLPVTKLAEFAHGEVTDTANSHLANTASDHKSSAEDRSSVGNTQRGYAEGSLRPAANDGRNTILLMGVDSRLGRSIVSRTDVMMLISFHPGTDTISILSIPRDLYVPIPGHGRDRINTAFVHGSDGGNPAGGAELAMQTVENALGVAIDHYVLVDFSTLIRVVDGLGGIYVDVPYTIDDPTYPDMNYGYDPLYIPEGLHYFDGATALKYARTRHQDNDFYRAQRQQQLIFAIRQKVLSLGVVDLIGRTPALYERVKNGIFTDLSLEELVQSVRVASNIPAENIDSAVLDYDYVIDYQSEDGASVLLLVKYKATPLIQNLFHDNTPPHGGK